MDTLLLKAVDEFAAGLPERSAKVRYVIDALGQTPDILQENLARYLGVDIQVLQLAHRSGQLPRLDFDDVSKHDRRRDGKPAVVYTRAAVTHWLVACLFLSTLNDRSGERARRVLGEAK